ncbi:rod shape-determining protein MreC [Herbidospora daliensis]|uniref:rod shape-determining protein MreC n=1 Tax=Herbidospora daliensis TaxID=295585 RepID=UPI0007C6DFF2|nr:rod shape-determining protein MreC [Herbidospora daliensis]
MKDSRRSRLFLGLLLAVALVLITVDHRSENTPVFGPLRTIVTSAFGAVERGVSTVTEPIGGFVGALAGAQGSREQITNLKAQNSKLEGELSSQRIDKRRSAELQAMLGLSGLGGYKVVPAQVVARRASPGFEDAVEIDAGTADGIKPDMTVLNGQGLVGRVVRATTSTATVVLLCDPASSTGARIENSGELGVISGLGANGNSGRRIMFRLLDSTLPIAAGTRLVSFGSQQGVPYVAGVPIGVIEKVEATPGELTRTAYAKPFADLSSIDVVGVVVEGPKRDPRDSLLPPAPKPAAKPKPKPKPATSALPGQQAPPQIARPGVTNPETGPANRAPAGPENTAPRNTRPENTAPENTAPENPENVAPADTRTTDRENRGETSIPDDEAA